MAWTLCCVLGISASSRFLSKPPWRRIADKETFLRIVQRTLREEVQAVKIDLGTPDLYELLREMKHLGGLAYLDLSKNELRGLPEEMGALHNLEHLNLCANRISSLPPTMACLEKLEYLDLSCNGMKDIPDVVCKITGLKLLDMRDNELTKVPEEICALEELTYLNLANNQITALPCSITKLLDKPRFLLILRSNPPFADSGVKGETLGWEDLTWRQRARIVFTDGTRTAKAD